MCYSLAQPRSKVQATHSITKAPCAKCMTHKATCGGKIAAMMWRSSMRRGELCEGSRSNIVLRQGGRFYTPPLSSGLLNGVYRQFLLQKGAIQERVLYAKDLENASAIYCINSVRGARRVRL